MFKLDHIFSAPYIVYIYIYIYIRNKWIELDEKRCVKEREREVEKERGRVRETSLIIDGGNLLESNT